VGAVLSGGHFGNAVEDPRITSISDAVSAIRKVGDREGPYAEAKELYLKQKIESFITLGRPIEFVIPAFPCKSKNNTHKVLGILPDYGEKVALQTLHRLIAEIEKHYAPGANVNIVLKEKCTLILLESLIRLFKSIKERSEKSQEREEYRLVRSVIFAVSQLLKMI